MKDLARTALTAKLVADEYKKVGDAAKAKLLTELDATGAERVRVRDVEGEDLGAAILAKGKVTASITDPAAFEAWVKLRYPDQIRTRVEVDGAWQTRLIATCTREGAPVDPETGEVIPGVELSQGKPYISIRPSDEARNRMATVLAEQGLPEIGGVT